MNAADTAWRRPPRPPRPRFLASSILPALTIFLTAILQISASNSLHEHENRNSDLYCNKTLVSTSQCSLRTKIPLCHNGTHASSQLRALTPPEHFSTPLLDTLPTILHEISFTRLAERVLGLLKNPLFGHFPGIASPALGLGCLPRGKSFGARADLFWHGGSGLLAPLVHPGRPAFSRLFLNNGDGEQISKTTDRRRARSREIP